MEITLALLESCRDRNALTDGYPLEWDTRRLRRLKRTWNAGFQRWFCREVRRRAFGSGKTHFLRQFLESRMDVTAEVPLTRSVDITKSLDVYVEVVREVRPPRRVERGIEALVQACLEKVRS